MVRVTARSGVLVGVALAVVTLAGCTTGSDGAAATSSAVSPSPSSSAATTMTSPSGGGSSAAPTAPVSTGSTGTPPTTAPTAPPAPTGTAPPDADSSCAASSLSLVAVPASGASGVEYAIVTFTNTGTAACTLTGFPGVSLLLGGQAVGSIATDTASPVTTVTLAPGGAAQAKVASLSTCNAPLSDALRVTLPGRSDFVDVAGQLRACHIEVDAITAA